MMIRCDFINILTFIAQFSDRLPPLAGYYASQFGTKESGRLWGAYINGVLCGALIAEVKEDITDIIYVAVSEEHRRKGVFGALLRELIKHSGAAVRLKYTPEQPEDGIDVFLRKIGFHSRPHLITKVIPVTDTLRTEWNKFTSGRSGKLLATLKQRGFAAMRFNEAPRELMDTLYEEMGKKFPSFLDPRRCPNPILMHHSFVTVREGSPVAFCAATSADGGKTAIVEHMAASSDSRGRGAFVPCLAASVDGLLSDGVCAKISFAYDPNNNRLPKMMTDDAWFSNMTVKQVYEYTLNKEDAK